MATSSPIPFLDQLFDTMVSTLKPPPGLVREGHQRLVLLLNHVLQQEPEAMNRLTRQRGRSVRVQWRDFTFDVVVTPAGLLNLNEAGAPADLLLTVQEPAISGMMLKTLGGEQPQIQIAGDVQFAAEVNWLVAHVRWDLEEDLSRLFGDAVAFRMAQAARGLAGAVRAFVTRNPAAKAAP